MIKATISHLKNNLRAYLRKVRAGDSVVIYDRDVPVARPERIETTDRGGDRLELLSVEGVTRPPRRALTTKAVRQLFRTPLTSASGLLDALERDRSEDC